MSLELKLKGNWNELKGKLKERYAELTDDDLMYAEGQEDQLLGKIQKKTGAAKEELSKLLFGKVEEEESETDNK
ncbi:CsbD family protein [Cyclobacteriaceae bacterium YHN15]|nr:CsbD family protein [Cyclobacteriaceae bacterium YHN15]